MSLFAHDPQCYFPKDYDDSDNYGRCYGCREWLDSPGVLGPDGHSYCAHECALAELGKSCSCCHDLHYDLDARGFCFDCSHRCNWCGAKLNGEYDVHVEEYGERREDGTWSIRDEQPVCTSHAQEEAA